MAFAHSNDSIIRESQIETNFQPGERRNSGGCRDVPLFEKPEDNEAFERARCEAHQLIPLEQKSAIELVDYLEKVRQIIDFVSPF